MRGYAASDQSIFISSTDLIHFHRSHFRLVCDACVSTLDQEVEYAFFLVGSIFYSCRSSHLEITSLIVIDPLSPGELDGTDVIPTQTP